MRNVAAFLHGQVLLWCGRLVFPVAPVGDFVATHAVRVSPRKRQEVTRKRWRAEPPTMGVHRSKNFGRRLMPFKRRCRCLPTFRAVVFTGSECLLASGRPLLPWRGIARRRR